MSIKRRTWIWEGFKFVRQAKRKRGSCHWRWQSFHNLWELRFKVNASWYIILHEFCSQGPLILQIFLLLDGNSPHLIYEDFCFFENCSGEIREVWTNFARRGMHILKQLSHFRLSEKIIQNSGDVRTTIKMFCRPYLIALLIMHLQTKSISRMAF